MIHIERALATPGWMEPEELAYIAELASRHKLIVEIGSWRGRSAVAWAQNTQGFVWCIDTWANDAYGISFPQDPPDLHQRHDWLLKEFQRNTEGLNNIFPLRTNSLDGARRIREAGIRPDVIFIDAGHNYNDVVTDIEAWRPLLAEGGVLMGHDYSYEGWPDVKTVVDKMIPNFRTIQTIWTTEA